MILVHAVLSLGLVVYHVHAESSSVVNATNNDGADGTHVVIDRILSGPMSWTTMDKIVFGVLIMMGMELLGWIVRNTGSWVNAKQIPVRGKHLDTLTNKDLLFIGISKAQTGPFVYFFLRFICSPTNNDVVLWSLDDLSFKTVLLPLPIIFIIFDFFYTALHWALHIKAIYGWIHKHHHIQKAPSRGTDDAINVHPIEFFLGEYNHLWSWYLFCTFVSPKLNIQVHALAALVYLVVSGLLAGWNHTRYDLTFTMPGLALTIFDSKAHDVHHRIPQSNYGQYTMFWDYMFGTYRSYNPKDRINPNSQLDPTTGMSIEYTKSLEKQEKSQ